MILVAGGTKGGSGKTTIATTFAIMRTAAGRDVLLIDADDQETASDFTILRNERLPGGAGYTSIKLTGSAVRTETQRLASTYDDVIIDTSGRDTASQRAALTVAEVLLVPCSSPLIRYLDAGESRPVGTGPPGRQSRAPGVHLPQPHRSRRPG